MNTINNQITKMDLIIVFLILFTSVGWIVNSSTGSIKIVFFLLLSFMCIIRIMKKGINKINISKLIQLSIPIFAMIIIGTLIHNRAEDYFLFFKYIIVIMLLLTLPVEVFWNAIPRLLKILFPFIVLGYILQLIGIYFKVPDFMIAEGRKDYFITPLLTVFLKGDASRAFGPFWEPGILSFVANLSILSKLYFSTIKENNKHYWREIIIVLISQSSGGFIVTLFIFSTLFIKNKFLQLLFMFMFFILFFYSLSLDFNVMRDSIANMGNILTLNILNRDLLTDPSFAARIYDLYVPFLLGMKSFWGYPSISNFITFITIKQGYSAAIITNTFGYLSYFYGFTLMLVYLITLIYSLIKSSTGKNFIIVPIIILMLFSNPIPTVILMIWILLQPSQLKKIS